jgi:hypothetical protein
MPKTLAGDMKHSDHEAFHARYAAITAQLHLGALFRYEPGRDVAE